MKPEQDSDAELVVNWRGAPNNAALKVPPEHQQTMLPFKQKKASSTTSADRSTKIMRESDAVAENIVVVKNETGAKSSAAGFAAPPVYYDLSDSEGTPIIRPPVRSLAERRAAAANPASTSWKQNANAEVVTLDSDSDEEMSPGATSKSVGKVDKLSQPIKTQGGLPEKASLDDEGNLGSRLSGKVDELTKTIPKGGFVENVISLDDEEGLKPSVSVVNLTETIQQGGLLEKAICLDDVGTVGGSKFSGNVVKLAETISRGLVENAMSLDVEGLMGSISSRTDLPLAETAAAALTFDWDFGFSRDVPSTTLNSPSSVQLNKVTMQNPVIACDDHLLQTASGSRKRSSPLQPVFEVLTSDDDGCNSEPEWLPNHEPASPSRRRTSGGFVPHNYRDEGCSEQFPPNSGGNGEVRDHGAGTKRPSLNIPGCEPHENLETTVCSSATERPKLLDLAPGVVRNCFGAIHDSVSEDLRRSSPDHTVFDLTGDDDCCSSEQEWLRDYEPVSLRGSLNSGASVPNNFRGQGSRDQFLLSLGGDREESDHGTGKKGPSLYIPGLESPENRETTVSRSAKELEPGEGLLVGDKAKRKRRKISGAAAEKRPLDDASNLENVVSTSQRTSKARKGPVSEEELAAREAQKQKDRELKKALQEEEKKRKEEQREELKRQKLEAAERRRLEKEQEKENDKWRKGKFALQNTTVCVDTTLLEIKDLGPLLLHQLGSKDHKIRVSSNPIRKTIVWTMKRPSTDSQVDTEALGSQADDVINSQLSNSQLALEEVEMKYVVVVLQGEEFADLVADRKLDERLSGVRMQYPTYSICYIINGLMKHLKKKEQLQYKTRDQSWTRPNVEQALAEFITHHPGTHFRLCIDESEIVDHVVGLTRSLAECPFKKKLTSISVHANGECVSKGDPNKDVIKKNVWLKFLVAIPKINGAIAIAIERQYRTMRALLDAYLDPHRTVYEKELLLQNLVKDTSNGDSRRVGPHVSKLIYRILMARDGNLSTEDVEEGADHFTC